MDATSRVVAAVIRNSQLIRSAFESGASVVILAATGAKITTVFANRNSEIDLFLRLDEQYETMGEVDEFGGYSRYHFFLNAQSTLSRLRGILPNLTEDTIDQTETV